MSAREKRATKRNIMVSSEPEEVKVKATKVQKVIKIPSSSLQKQKTSTQKVKSSSSVSASASDVILTSATRAITGFASAASAASAEIISSIDYCDDLDTHRQIVIVPASGEQFWPVQNMAFFRTSGTSNQETEWLRGTFYPTSGLTCKHRDTPDIIRNYAECLKGNRDHASGHIAKMSDYTSNVRGTRIYTPDLFSFMDDLFNNKSNGLLSVTNRLFTYPYDITKHPDKMDKILSNPDFASHPASDVAFQLHNLENAIKNYFLTEEQLKLSYRLTPENTGLWGFRFYDFSLSDFCIQRWGLHKFNVPDIDQCTPNTMDVYDFIHRHDANIEFDDMKREVSLLLTPDMNAKTLSISQNIALCASAIRNYETKYKFQKGIITAKGKTKNKKKTKKAKSNKTKKNNKKHKNSK